MNFGEQNLDNNSKDNFKIEVTQFENREDKDCKSPEFCSSTKAMNDLESPKNRRFESEVFRIEQKKT